MTSEEKAMAPDSSTLAWEFPWTEQPGRLQSMGLRRVGHDWATWLSLFTFMHWRRKWQPTLVFLPGESQGWEPGGLPSMGSHRVGYDWHDLAAAAAAMTNGVEHFFLGLFEICKSLVMICSDLMLIFQVACIVYYCSVLNAFGIF